MATRSYVASLPGGTATTTIQMQGKSAIKGILVSMLTAAAGTVEVSMSASSQISSAQPSQDVLTRVRNGATAGYAHIYVPLNKPVTAFENVYVHQTGAGNVGEITLVTGS